jgi:hypothetical protein
VRQLTELSNKFNTKEIIKKIICNYPESTISVEINDVMYTNFNLLKNSVYTKIDLVDLPNHNADKIIIGTISLEDINKI